MTVQSLPLRDLPPDLDRDRLPQHVAVVMDGNGRWAKNRGLPRTMGHRQGVSALKEILRCCDDWGIGALTAYAFSTENWRRPHGEVDFLMALFERVLWQELQEMMRENVRIWFAGDVASLPQSLQRAIAQSVEATQDNQGIHFTVASTDRAIAQSVEATQDNQGIHFTVAINYGGRQEIVQACRTIATQVKEGVLAPAQIDEALFSRYLYTTNVRDPDLLIRTSGEMRISNFLLWQTAYAEIYITDTLWPDFDRAAFHQALLAYQKRDRRFGGIQS